MKKIMIVIMFILLFNCQSVRANNEDAHIETYLLDNQKDINF